MYNTTLHYREYAPILNDHKIKYRAAGNWLLSGILLLENRWLLFVSCIAVDTPDLLKKVLPLLRSRHLAFRIAKNQFAQYAINAGETEIDNFGKTLTIYPRSIDELRALILPLQTLTEGVRGPCLDDSIRVGKNLFVGYAERIEQDGTPVNLSIPDKQLIPFAIPKEYPLHRKLKRIWARRFAPCQLLTYSVKAALYKSIDIRKLSACMVKRGRIYTADDPFGRHVKHRLETERKWMQRFKGIIPVPEVYLLFEYLGDIFLAMELIDGVVLKQWITELYNGKTWADLSPAVRLLILQVFFDVTVITNKVHAEGCVICDLTADNLMIPKKYTPGKLPYAIDLELVYDFKNGKPNPHYMLGTPGYACPEQMSYQIPTARNDLYSLGALLIFCLTAVHPFEIISKDKKEVREQLRQRGINDGLIYLVLQCLARNPVERPTINSIQATIQTEQEKLNQKIHLQTAA